MEENTKRARVDSDQGDHCAHFHTWEGFILFVKVSGQRVCPVEGMLCHHMSGVGTRYWLPFMPLPFITILVIDSTHWVCIMRLNIRTISPMHSIIYVMKNIPVGTFHVSEMILDANLYFGELWLFKNSYAHALTLFKMHP